jgi:NlpC/P60 family putative phage cell wall peptidase
MPITRADIVAHARAWIGTTFAHQGRIKSLGCDCVGLGLCVADEMGLIDRTGVPFKRTDSANYSAQPLGTFVHEEIQRRMIEKPIVEMEDGDVLTIRVPGRDDNLRVAPPCHMAICSTVGELRYMIHAYQPNGKVVENILDEKWRRRIAGCFTFCEVK